MKNLLELFNLSFIVELIGLAFSIFLLRSAKDHWKFFIWYGVFVVVVEVFGWQLRINGVPNHLLYNFFLIVSTVFYLYVVYMDSNKQVEKRTYLVSGFTFIAFALINLIFGQGLFVFNGFTHLFASCLMILVAIVFYSKILSTENNVNGALNEDFWFVNGVFLFHIGIIFLTIFQDTLIIIYKKTGFNYYRYIIQFINVLFYVCLIVSFYLKSKAMRKEISTAKK